jgi:hypothetical protein
MTEYVTDQPRTVKTAGSSISGIKHLKRASDNIHCSYKYNTLTLTTRVLLRNLLIHFRVGLLHSLR